MNFEAIHNYYESLVIEYINNDVANNEYNEDFLEDVACLALNQLPARYVRHDVDMAFFLTSSERQKMHDNIVNAVNTAIATVSKRERESDND